MNDRFVTVLPDAAANSPAAEWREYAEEAAAQTALLRETASHGDLDQSPSDEEVYVPDHYEPNYAYPLVVWLLPSDASTGELRRLMRQLSERNYFGLALRSGSDEVPEARLCAAVARLRRRANIHTERIYLAGRGDSATGALQWGLRRPEWFGGVIALSPALESMPRVLSQFHELRGKQVFLSACAADADACCSRIDGTQRLLWMAGVSVSGWRTDSHNPIDASVLRQLNHWLVSTIEQPAAVA